MTPVAVKELEDMASTLEQSELDALLYDGVDQDEINYAPIFELAAELFTHLGIECTDWIFPLSGKLTLRAHSHEPQRV